MIFRRWRLLSIKHLRDLRVRLLQQAIFVAHGQPFGRNRRADLDRHWTGLHPPGACTVDVERSVDRDRKYRQTGSQREQESAALEWTHGALARAALLRKHDDGVALANAIDRLLE